jgi:hypothetical protein
VGKALISEVEGFIDYQGVLSTVPGQTTYVFGIGMYLAQYDPSAAVPAFPTRNPLTQASGVLDDWLYLEIRSFGLPCTSASLATEQCRSYRLHHKRPIVLTQGWALNVVYAALGPATTAVLFTKFIRFKIRRIV